MQPSPQVRQRPLLALLVRLLAAAMISVMLTLVKLAGERGVSLVETIFWRQLLPAVAIAGWLATRGQLGRLRTARFPAHAQRAAVGLLGLLLNLGVVLLLPLTESTVLGFTSPIFAVILAALLLKERVGPTRWLAVVLGLAGVAIIAWPDRSALPLDGLTVGVGAAFMVALISIQIRDLSRTEDSLRIVFWFSALTAPAMALPALLMGNPHDNQTWLILGGVALFGGIGQILLTAALRIGSVSSVIVMDYSAFGWAMLWGWLLFDHLPPAATWAGAPIIVAAGLIIVWREHRLHLAKPAAPLGS